ncbi:MAG: hypothetical protein IJO91_06875 [Oscillospiraceae bacterium]|nr:hypothetical protein [Oscillospiraceae bacterium]
MEEPEYLYHYTNVESLALILKNRTIRFRSLDQMDDLQEQQTADLKNIGRFCFISSWTDSADESIPMWNMYASLNAGVRIKLCTNPFVGQDITRELSDRLVFGGGYIGCYSYIPFETMIEQGFLAKQAAKGDMLRKVEYTNDKNLLYPRIRSTEDEGKHLYMGKLGVYKNTHWAFQNEWRYIFTTIPIKSAPIKTEELLATWDEMAYDRDNANPPFTYYDMTIHEEAFADMEITLSPKISAGNREIVSLLKKCYNKKVRIVESDLINLI